MRRTFPLVLVLSVILVVASWGVLRGGRHYGPFVLAMTLVPLAGALVARLEFKRLIPDIIFGTIDTGMLTVAAVTVRHSLE